LSSCISCYRSKVKNSTLLVFLFIQIITYLQSTFGSFFLFKHNLNYIEILWRVRSFNWEMSVRWIFEPLTYQSFSTRKFSFILPWRDWIRNELMPGTLYRSFNILVQWKRLESTDVGAGRYLIIDSNYPSATNELCSTGALTSWNLSKKYLHAFFDNTITFSFAIIVLECYFVFK
jgi:hypothetical protein